jgi:hypothetical protein
MRFSRFRAEIRKINIGFSLNFGRSIELLFLEKEYNNFIFVALSQKVYSAQQKIYHFHEFSSHFRHIVCSNSQALIKTKILFV